MQDRFYIGGDLGKRNIKTPNQFANQNSPYSVLEKNKHTNVADVTKVYNPKIEQMPIHF